jgi:hypothetical protein
MKPIVVCVGVGLLALFVGLGFILPAVAKLRAFGYLAGADMGLLFLGTVIALAGPITAVILCRRRA